jgi:hypothetical protein
MMAAVLQGVPMATIDTDLWIDLPARQYSRVLNLCVRLGARIAANTVVELTDDTVINFLYRVDGLASFKTEARRARRIEWLGQTVKVLPLDRIIRSKEFIRRPKDIAHLPILRQVQISATCQEAPAASASR